MRREFTDDVEWLKRAGCVNQRRLFVDEMVQEARPFIDWINAYPRQFYELVGLAAVYQNDSAYFWDPDGIRNMSKPHRPFLSSAENDYD